MFVALTLLITSSLTAFQGIDAYTNNGEDHDDWNDHQPLGAYKVEGWKKNFGGYGNYFEAVAATLDGFVAVGYSWQSSFGLGDWSDVAGNGGDDAIIVKLDLDGNVLWKKNFGGNGNDCFYGVTATSDGFVAVGYSHNQSFGNGDWSGVAGNGRDEA